MLRVKRLTDFQRVGSLDDCSLLLHTICWILAGCGIDLFTDKAQDADASAQSPKSTMYQTADQESTGLKEDCKLEPGETVSMHTRRCYVGEKLYNVEFRWHDFAIYGAPDQGQYSMTTTESRECKNLLLK